VPAGKLARMPPGVVHGFRNGTDAELRYLNLHAPGRGFADYLRAMRDGRELTYDQFDPPPDGGRPPAEAVFGTEVLRAGGVTLLADVEEIAVAEITSEPADRPAPHLHRDHVESFYVLEGELAITAGDRELRAEAGAWAQVPPGVPHAVSGSARALCLHTPSCGFGAFVRVLQATADEAAAAARAGFDQEPAP
jgi:quercetin dioxygenase-like cupin family protein